MGPLPVGTYRLARQRLSDRFAKAIRVAATSPGWMCFRVVCTVHADDAAVQRWSAPPATSCTARSITTLCACQGSDWPGLRLLYGPGETAISRSQCGPSWLRLARTCR